MKRRFAIVLSLLCLLTLIPTSAYASGNIVFHIDGLLDGLRTYSPEEAIDNINWYFSDSRNWDLDVDLNGSTMEVLEPIKLKNSATLTIHDGIIDNRNWESYVFELSGKGVKLQMYNMTIMRCSESDGPAIYVSGKECVVENPKQDGSVVIKSCRASNCGAAIKLNYYSDRSRVSYINFEENYAKDGGGAIITNGENNIIEHCRFTKNSCDNEGGAIYVWNDCEINDCFFTGNRTKDGKDIYVDDYLKLHNCTFDDHTRNDAICLDDDDYLVEDSGNSFVSSVGTILSQGMIWIVAGIAVIAACIILVLKKKKKGTAN